MPLIEPHMNIIVDRPLTLLSIPSLPFRTVPIFCYCLHVSLHSLVVFSSCLLHAKYIVQFLMFAGFATFVWHSYNIHMTFLTLEWHFQYNQITLIRITIHKLELIQPTRLYPARDPKYFHATLHVTLNIFMPFDVIYVITFQHTTTYLMCIYGLSSSHPSNLWYYCT